MRPLITLAIPNRNYARYLGKCLDSVVMQNGLDVEILISDNCSDDDSWCIIKDFARCDARIRAIRQKQNIGMAANLNFLLTEARGHFFKMVISDDWLHSNFLADFRETISKLAPEKIGVVICGYDWYFDGVDKTEQPTFPSQYKIPPSFNPKDDLQLARLALHFSMPSTNALNTDICKEEGGYKPLDSMRLDAIAMTNVMLNKKSETILAMPRVACTQRIHTQNNRKFWTGYDAVAGEMLVVQRFKQAASKSDCGWISKWERQIAGEMLIALFRLPIKRCRKTAAGISEMARANTLGLAIAATPPRLLEKIIRNLNGAWRRTTSGSK